MAKPNGMNGLLGKFVLAGFVVTTGTVTGVFANWIANGQRQTQVKQSEHGERISALEAVQAGIHLSLQRIDKNVNRLLERKETR